MPSTLPARNPCWVQPPPPRLLASRSKFESPLLRVFPEPPFPAQLHLAILPPWHCSTFFLPSSFEATLNVHPPLRRQNQSSTVPLALNPPTGPHSSDICTLVLRSSTADNLLTRSREQGQGSSPDYIWSLPALTAPLVEIPIS